MYTPIGGRIVHLFGLDGIGWDRFGGRAIEGGGDIVDWKLQLFFVFHSSGLIFL